MKAINVYVALVCGVATALLIRLDWHAVYESVGPDWQGFAVLAALALLSESMSVKLEGGRSGGTFTITFIPLLASVLLYGPQPAVAMFFLVGLIAEFIIHKKTPLRASFNSGQYVISAYSAGVVFAALGGRSMLESPVSGDAVTMLASFVGFGAVFLLSNHGLVAGAISLSKGIPILTVWHDLVGRSGVNIFYDLLISPIAIAVAALYEQLYSVGLLLVLLPMLFIRHFYTINYRLQRANRDLLNALVKTIETRDPYTSGHSVRVAQLSRYVAEALHLSPREIERIEQSALLHDIGKIDPIFAEILHNPNNLTPDERRVIESHVITGETFLRTMSSVPDEVISDVRHHHERVDGKGYPDGIQGDEIPIGARIIKVCDAVDAMLSDRPYRSGLSLEMVREELLAHAARQFDQKVVECLVLSDILERHAASLRQVAAVRDEDSGRRTRRASAKVLGPAASE